MKQAKVMTEQEVKRVLAVIASQTHHAPRNRLTFMLSYLSGMRACEIAALTWGDVMDTNGQPKSEIRLTAAKTKGSKARMVVVSERLQKEIARYAGDQSVDMIISSKPLLPSQKQNKHFSANTLVQLLGQIYREAGIDGASSHSGRRTFITTLAAKGVGARVLQHLAGHSSLQTTQRYIDVNDSMLHEAVRLL